MVQEGFKRKLTAILSADVMGYSRLMRDDEEATVRDLATHRILFNEIIQQYHGRVVDSPGDNILAEFGSVVDAVNGAIKIQEEINKRNAGISQDRRMAFRIGINLGDVIEEEKQIYGDGVNIAARVEGLASAGGISISGTVYEHIKDKLSLGYHYLGKQDVKNITEPVRIYRLLTDPEDAGKMIGEEKFKSRKFRYAVFSGLALIILVAGGLVIWKNYFFVQIEPASVEKMTYPLPDKPSIAVLPFDNIGGVSEDEYLVDGITEDIITALSKIGGMLVIARNSTNTYKGKAVKVKQVSEELGVRYVLGGSVRKSGGRLRITAQLIDAIKGHQLWAERYDRELKDIFTLQDEITMNIITALRVELKEGEQARVLSKGTNNLEAYIKLLQGRELVYRFNKDDNALARQKFREAIALDPAYAISHLDLGMTYMMDVWLQSSKSPKQSFSQAIDMAQKALALDDSLPNIHHSLGLLYGMTGQYEKAVAECERAIELGPNDEAAYRRLGVVLSYVGRNEEAIALYEKAIRLNPFPRATTYFHLGMAYLFTRRCEDAIATCRKAVQAGPSNLLAHVFLTAAYGSCGREKEACTSAAEVLAIGPNFSVEDYEKQLRFKEEDKRLVIDGLRKAGLK